jgi:hypothetical protein
VIDSDWQVVVRVKPALQEELLEAEKRNGLFAEACSMNVSWQANKSRNEELAEGASESFTETRSLESPDWADALSHFRLQQDYLLACLTQGGWICEVFAATADGPSLPALTANLHEIVGTRTAYGFVAAWKNNERLYSLFTTSDLASVFDGPPYSVPGLRIKEALPSGRNHTNNKEFVILGTYSGTSATAKLGISDFEGHAFLVGTTGSGKSTTVISLLKQLWNDYGIPFLIIDPVKNDYAPIVPQFKGSLEVVTASELKMGVLKPITGGSHEQHISRLSGALKGAFSFPQPVPYVVSYLLDQAATNPSITWTQFLGMADKLVESLGYAEEVTSNIQAALLTRLKYLSSPSRANRFTFGNNRQIERLLKKPAVVTLADIADDEERAFIILCLAMLVWENAKLGNLSMGTSGIGNVKHVLVFEEAHRICPEVPQIANTENSSAQAESARLITSMLAEIRSYGEQVFVLDQSPCKVAADVLRNTNTKIAHRLLDPEDQRKVGGSMGLAENDCKVLASLERGQVLVSTISMPEPEAISVKPKK